MFVHMAPTNIPHLSWLRTLFEDLQKQWNFSKIEVVTVAYPKRKVGS